MLKRIGVIAALAVLLASCGGEDTPERQAFVKECGPVLPRLDCECFYDQTVDYPAVHTTTVINFLAVKNSYPAAVQRNQLEATVGANAVTPVWQASVACSR